MNSMNASLCRDLARGGRVGGGGGKVGGVGGGTPIPDIFQRSARTIALGAPSWCY